MSKTTKNILIVLVIVLLVFGIILAIYQNFKSEPIDANVEKDNILDDANTGLENLINGILDEDNEENKENTENTEDTEDANKNATSNTQGTTTQNQGQSSKEENLGNQTTPGEKKAIELAKAEWKKEWGNLDNVSFNNVMIQGDGKYVVSVNDSKTTKVICRYVVDTITGLVTEQ